MDPVFAKLIESREKSIKVLESEIARFDELMSSSKVASVAASLVSVAKVKRQRLEKLRGELLGLRQAAAAQMDLIPAVDPVVNRKR